MEGIGVTSTDGLDGGISEYMNANRKDGIGVNRNEGGERDGDSIHSSLKRILMCVLLEIRNR